jgi:vaccinia related kinase
MSAKRLKHLGIPRYIASGIYEYNGKEFRFLAMDRYSKDLQMVLNENNNQLNENIVLYLTRQILYSLEYIHSKGYSHADIKGANLMLKSDKEVYLVDYGLAHRFIREGDDHQAYVLKPDAKHNGTIEYTSRDAHDGVRKFYSLII